MVNGQSSVVSFTYNGLGDRLSETVNGVTTIFVLDLNTGLTQVLSDGINTYLYGLGRVSQVSTTDCDYFLGDALGSVRQLTDGQGTVILAQSYEPYGSVMVTAGEDATKYGFTGEMQENGLIYLRARDYLPTDGIFLMRDTFRGYANRPATLNNWIYTAGNPISFIDPSGNILEEQQDSANNLVKFLREDYGVNVIADWGYTDEIWDLGRSSMRGSIVADLFPESCKHEWYPGLWTMPDLNIITLAVYKMQSKMGGIGNFLKGRPSVDIRLSKNACGKGCTLPFIGISFLYQGKTTEKILFEEYDKAINLDLDFDKWSVVHEFGHWWDLSNFGMYSLGLEEVTGGYITWPWKRSNCDTTLPGCNAMGYYYKGKPAKGSDYKFNPLEDFAESYAAYFYPDDAKKWVDLNFEQALQYSDYRNTKRWYYINYLITGEMDWDKFKDAE
jgi:RHS repeat-associated protein